jgi:hypothetical protein
MRHMMNYHAISDTALSRLSSGSRAGFVSILSFTAFHT